MPYGPPPDEECFMRTAPRWTSADLEVLPDDGKRYEIIDGELYMSRQPHWHHQRACVQEFAPHWKHGVCRLGLVRRISHRA